jgi:hypothetical protein
MAAHCKTLALKVKRIRQKRRNYERRQAKSRVPKPIVAVDIEKIGDTRLDLGRREVE